MADVNEEKANACRVNQSEKGVVQYLGDEIRNRLYLGFLDKMEIGQVDEDEDEDGDTGVGHGFGAQGDTAGGGLNRILSTTGLAVLQEENDASDNVEEEDGVETQFKNRNKNA